MRIEYLDLWFCARAEKGGRLGPFPGKTLRGALGLALKRTVCRGRSAPTRCEQCILREQCAYSVIFEGIPPTGREIMRKYPRIPQPFVLLVEPRQERRLDEGRRLRFGLRLFGPAVRLHPYVVQAVEAMLAGGLGGDRIPLALEDVSDGRSSIYRAGATVLKPPRGQYLLLPSEDAPSPRRIRVAFRTPLRMRTSGRIAAHPSLEEILRAAVRRARILGAFYGEGGPDVPTPSRLLDDSRLARLLDSDLERSAVRRFSGRQKRSMVLTGVTGRVAYSWPAGRPGPQGWLATAAVLHIGKATTFGFGRIDYEVEPG